MNNNQDDNSRNTDASQEWNSIILKEFLPAVPVSLVGNGLNMFKLTLTLTPVADDGTGARPSVYVSPQVFREAITLLDYGQSQITPLTYLSAAPTIDNLPEFTGWAYTDEPNDFVLNTFGVNASTANQADYDPNQHTLTFYVLCKTATARDIRIGYRVKPTSGAEIIDTINGTNGFTGHYVAASASAQTRYSNNDLRVQGAYVPHDDDSDDVDPSNDNKSGFYWRQFNYTIDIGGYSGPLYYRVNPLNRNYVIEGDDWYPEDIVIYNPCKSRSKNGYATQVFIWNAETEKNPKIYINGVWEYGEIQIGENTNNINNIRITLLFVTYANTGILSEWDDNNEIVFYDSTGKSGKFSINAELPSYPQLRFQQQITNVWNPIGASRGGIPAQSGNSIGSFFILSETNRYLGGQSDETVVLNANLWPPSVNYDWVIMPALRQSFGDITIKLYSTNAYLKKGNQSSFDDEVEYVATLVNQNSNMDTSLYFFILLYSPCLAFSILFDLQE